MKLKTTPDEVRRNTLSNFGKNDLVSPSIPPSDVPSAHEGNRKSDLEKKRTSRGITVGIKDCLRHNFQVERPGNNIDIFLRVSTCEISYLFLYWKFL